MPSDFRPNLARRLFIRHCVSSRFATNLPAWLITYGEPYFGHKRPFLGIANDVGFRGGAHGYSVRFPTTSNASDIYFSFSVSRVSRGSCMCESSRTTSQISVKKAASTYRHRWVGLTPIADRLLRTGFYIFALSHIWAIFRANRPSRGIANWGGRGGFSPITDRL